MELPNIKTSLLIAVISAGLGGYVTFRMLPPKEITKVEEKEVIKNHTVTQIHEVTKPDGTKESNTTIVNDNNTTKDHIESSITSKYVEKQWFFSAGVARTSLTDNINIYQFNVNRRILGPIYLGGSISSEKEVGLTIGMEF